MGAGLGNERAATVTPTWAWCIASHVGPWDGSRAHVGAGLGIGRAATVMAARARRRASRPTWDRGAMGHFEPDGIGTSAEHI